MTQEDRRTASLELEERFDDDLGEELEEAADLIGVPPEESDS